MVISTQILGQVLAPDRRSCKLQEETGAELYRALTLSWEEPRRHSNGLMFMIYRLRSGRRDPSCSPGRRRRPLPRGNGTTALDSVRRLTAAMLLFGLCQGARGADSVEVSLVAEVRREVEV